MLKVVMNRFTLYILVLQVLISCKPQPKISEDQFLFSAYHEGTFSIRKFKLLKDSTYNFHRRLATKEFNLNGKWRRRADSYYLYDTLYNTYYGKIYLKEGEAELDINPTDSALFDFTNSNFRIKVW